LKGRASGPEGLKLGGLETKLPEAVKGDNLALIAEDVTGLVAIGCAIPMPVLTDEAVVGEEADGADGVVDVHRFARLLSIYQVCQR
tara:strand:- start:344 stop:601 length:258 start_codon:yes stop_codon:yes gene_type:complete